MSQSHLTEDVLNTIYGLSRDRSGGHERPHKPALLLAVLDLVNAGEIQDNRIELNDALITRFKSIFEIVKQGNDRASIQLPFYYLSGDSFWTLAPRTGNTPLYVPGHVRAPKSIKQLRENATHAELKPEFWESFSNPISNAQLVAAIITRFFRDQESELLSLLGTPLELHEEAREYLPYRDGAFRKIVREIYDHRCAACGLRIRIKTQRVLIEAAHLIPWSESHNDHPSNGLALCRNHHWAMDEFLIAPCPDSKSPTGIWKVSNALDSRIPDHKELISLHNSSVFPPEDGSPAFSPSYDALRWREDKLLVH